MDTLEEKSEPPREHGRREAQPYLPLFAEGHLEPFLGLGAVLVSCVCEEEQDQKEFLLGWRMAWEDRDLLLELCSDDDQSLAECTRIVDRRVLIVERQIFHRARLCIGPKDGTFDGYYETTYDYSSPEEALNAMTTWKPEENHEPDGWHRHPDTRRYRIGGDKDLEWVKDNDQLNLEQNVAHAIQVTQGMDRVIMTVEENNEHLGSAMPKGTQFFVVTSQSATCTHSVRCTWPDHVYHYEDRSVVVAFRDLLRTTLGTVGRRLKGGK